MELKEVKLLSDIQQGDTIIITGDKLKCESVKVEMIKTSENDGVEIIFNKSKNLFFNLGMYLNGKSWVKECMVVDQDVTYKKKRNYEKFIKILDDMNIQYDIMDGSKKNSDGDFFPIKVLKLRDEFFNSVKYHFNYDTGEIMELVVE